MSKDDKINVNDRQFLGEGLIGRVYLVNTNKGKYAMKIEYIKDKNDPYLNNELLFVNQVASKYPEHFIQLIKHEFIDDCKEKIPEYPDWLPIHEKKYLIDLRSSKICVAKFYSLIDTTISNLEIQKMSIQQRYSLLIQILYINYLFESNGFVHGDFHHGNIGVLKVDKNKTIKIFGKSIPTYGYQYQAIDYGGILYKDTLSLTKKYQQHDITEKQHFDEHLIIDKLGIIRAMINDSAFWDYIKENKIVINSYEDDLNLIMSQNEIKLLENISKNKWLLFDLYKLLFTNKFQQLILGKYFKHKLEIKSLIPTADIVYAYLNFNNSKELIEYFIARLENCE